MAKLIFSGNVYTDTEISTDEVEGETFISRGGNLGSLPTLYDNAGHFVSIVNWWFFDLRVKKNKNMSSYSRALLLYWTFLEDSNLFWDSKFPIDNLKPTYKFRFYLLSQVSNGKLSYGTASNYIRHVVQFYKWAIHANYLIIENKKEAPFKVEDVTVEPEGDEAHHEKKFIVRTTDLRIPNPNNSQHDSMNPLGIEFLKLMIQQLEYESEEFKLQCLLAVRCGLRIKEVCSLTVEALNFATPLTDDYSLYQLNIGQSNGVKTKYDKARCIEMPRELLSSLKTYVQSERRLNRLNKLYSKIEHIRSGQVLLLKSVRDEYERCDKYPPIFISEQGNPVNTQSTSARWSDFRNNARKLAPNFNHKFHDLRCTYGTYRLNDLLENGMPPTEALGLLMDWMGHKDEKTTWKYIRFLNRKKILERAIAMLDTVMHEALGGKNG